MTDASATATPPPGGLAALLSDTQAMARRTARNYRRIPAMLMAATVQPIMTVLLFYYIFGGAIKSPGGRYIDFLIPGVLGWSVIIGAQGTAVGLAGDVKSGLVQRMWSLPMARSAFVSGRIWADAERNVFVGALVIALGLILGFRPHGGIGILAGVALMVAFGFAASWMFAAIGLAVGDPEGTQAATFPPMILLVFSSSAFVPPSTMPGWLQPYAEHQPLSAVLTATRGLIVGGATTHAIIEALGWVVVLLVVFVPLGLRCYRKAA